MRYATFMMEQWEETHSLTLLARVFHCFILWAKGQRFNPGTHWQQRQVAAVTQPNSSCKHLASLWCIQWKLVLLASSNQLLWKAKLPNLWHRKDNYPRVLSQVTSFLRPQRTPHSLLTHTPLSPAFSPSFALLDLHEQTCLSVPSLYLSINPDPTWPIPKLISIA